MQDQVVARTAPAGRLGEELSVRQRQEGGAGEGAAAAAVGEVAARDEEGRQ